MSDSHSAESVSVESDPLDGWEYIARYDGLTYRAGRYATAAEARNEGAEILSRLVNGERP